MCVSDTKCVPVNVDCAPEKLKVCTSVPTMDAHISSEQHKQCLKVHRLSKLSREQVKLTAPMNRLISIQQRELSKKLQVSCTQCIMTLNVELSVRGRGLHGK